MRNFIARYYPRQRPRRIVSRQRPYVPIPFTPDPLAYAVPARAAMVRPYVLYVERQRDRARGDRTRLGVAVLLDIAQREAVLA
ncbi:hypothetical protein GCM10023224_26730 [Streptomonospora halophila]|uniref:Uncharacterized protein n=1 Tax=Streptomonospora halophila TaxID=427369 RepID=A0ABP9GHQ4_9ACTN